MMQRREKRRKSCLLDYKYFIIITFVFFIFFSSTTSRFPFNRDESAGGPGGAAHRHDHAATAPSAGHQRFPVQDHGQYPPQLPSSQSYAQQRRQGTSELLSDELVQQQFQPDSDGYHGGHDPNGAEKHGQNGGGGKS